MRIPSLPPPTCSAMTDAGSRCRQYPLHGSDRCFWHSPATAAEAVEARRLGGLRRRREGTLSGAFDFQGLDSVAAIRRLLEVAALDALGLDNSLARARTLVAVAMAAARLLETGELQARLETLESAVAQRPAIPEAVFDLSADEGEIVFEADSSEPDTSGSEAHDGSTEEER